MATDGVSHDILDAEAAGAKAEAGETARSNLIEEVPVPGNCRECTFVLHNEDHTLGNSLRAAIMRNPEVEFAGYSVPHPLTREIHLRIVTRSDSVAPVDCLVKGLADLSDSAESLLRKFDAACEQYEAKQVKSDSS